MARNVSPDFIKDPYRSELSKRLSNPRNCCSEYYRCSRMGTQIPVVCELGPKAQKEFDLCVSKLLDLSDFEAWYPLRGAIRDLDQARALKTCAVMAALFAVTTKLTREGVLAKAIGYETAWEYGAKRLKTARVALKELEDKIREAEARRPDVLATTKFTDYKRALCDLVVCGLTALDSASAGARSQGRFWTSTPLSLPKAVHGEQTLIGFSPTSSRKGFLRRVNWRRL